MTVPYWQILHAETSEYTTVEHMHGLACAGDGPDGWFSIDSDALRTLERECLDNMSPELCISELRECEETIRSYWTRD